MDELDLLKQRADLLGIKYHANIGLEALKSKVNKHLADEQPPVDDAEAPVTDEPIGEPVVAKLSKAEAMAVERKKQRIEQLKLVRLRITNLNPAKKELLGEIITVGNKVLGTIRKFVPFGESTDNGYHVPYIIYTELKDRKFVSIKRRKVNGKEHIEHRLVPEYALEVLDQLTPAELKQLAAQQAAAQGL